MAPGTAPASPAISLEVYARIKAAIWETETPLEELLAQNSLDAATWRRHEKELALLIAQDASTGNGALSKRIREAVRKARSALTPDR